MRAHHVGDEIKSRRFIAPLHGLRGLAVLYVVISHIGNTGARLFPLPHDAIGKVGVWIFFGLSAHLLTSGLRTELSRLPRNIALPRYVMHRIFRIYPLYLVVLALHLVLGDIDTDTLLRHVVLTEGNGELWAIPVEFQYYLVIPILGVMGRRAAVVFLCVASVAVALYSSTRPETVFSNGLSILPKALPFLFASLFLIVLEPSSRWVRPAGWIALGLLLACTVISRRVNLGELPIWLAPWLSAAIGIAAAGLIQALTQPGRLSRAFSVWPLVWIGEISFSIYLLHMFVIRLVSQWSIGPMLSGWCALLLSIAMAACTYRMIERPGIEAGRRLARRWRSEPAANLA